MLLRPTEAADLAGLSTRAIYRAIQRGELRAVRLCSRLRIPRDDFDEWIARSEVRVEPAPTIGYASGTRDARELPQAPRRRGEGSVVSVERVERKDGTVVWRVRWRQGRRNRSKVLGRKRDADAFDAELVRRKRTGELAQFDAGKEPLADFGEEWWRLYAEPNLAKSTLQVYAVQWDAHVLPRLGSVPLRELTPEVINRFRLELEADGVGPASIRKCADAAAGRASARVRVGPDRVEPGGSCAQAAGRPGACRPAAAARDSRGDACLVAAPPARA